MSCHAVNAMEIPASSALAPIQEIMLRDSVSAPDAGHHIEQLELTFSRPFEAAEIAAAWRGTVGLCEVLRTNFTFTHGIPSGQRSVLQFPEMEIQAGLSNYHEPEYESDPLEISLEPDRPPWRTCFWPDQRRFVWTFHHALLDGRSITKVVRVFLELLAGASPQALALARWQEPSAEALRLAENYFRSFPRTGQLSAFPVEEHQNIPARRALGADFLMALEKRATALGISAATIVIWAWGQALAKQAGRDSVIVEQIRAGPPQTGCAGFTMNVFPLHISRGPVADLPKFRAELLEIRRFENVSPADFPLAIYPDTAVAPTIMIERATLRHALGDSDLLESVFLRERPAACLSATGHLHPDLELQVEGPNGQHVLDAWCEVLARPDFGTDGKSPSGLRHFSIAGVRPAAGRVRG